jgi:hypothetical protein
MICVQQLNLTKDKKGYVTFCIQVILPLLLKLTLYFELKLANPVSITVYW